MKQYVIGIDFGSDSVRALVVDANTGAELGEAVSYYARWQRGDYCDPSRNQFRQHPKDYLESMEACIKEALQNIGPDAGSYVKGIAVDTTGSTPCAVDAAGTPLALNAEFENNPNAMFILWKDHTAIQEAEEINTLAHSWGGIDYTKFEGGIYSSEWFWAKILHTLRNDIKVREAAASWVEHSDWIPAILTGNVLPSTMYRSRCAAGHKAMWHESFQGLPSEEFLTTLDPLLSGIRDTLYTNSNTAETRVGTLCEEWAAKLGLSTEVVIGGSAFDCHMGAVGGQIEPFDMVKVIGTSTCDIMVTPPDILGDKLVRGICGQVDGSVLPNMIGLEAGQSAFGDVYAWFKRFILWPIEELIDDPEIRKQAAKRLLPAIEAVAEKLPVEDGVIALDWLNGRRTPDADQRLKGAIAGLTLGTTAPRVYRSLVEATAFGAKAIMDRCIDEGVEIKRVIAIGGVAKKSTCVMQILADVMDKEILVASSDQACALGAAMFAAVAAGLYETLEEAQKTMGGGFSATYSPNPENAEKYKHIYDDYTALGKLLEGYYHR